MMRGLSRDRLAVLAGLVVPVALAAALVPFRSSIPNTDAALAMILVVVAVAANGYRLAGILAAVSVAVWFDFFLTRPYETVLHHPADRHRDDRPAAGDRRGGHRDRRLGTPPARWPRAGARATSTESAAPRTRWRPGAQRRR